jgi:hypothetical protein
MVQTEDSNLQWTQLPARSDPFRINNLLVSLTIFHAHSNLCNLQMQAKRKRDRWRFGLLSCPLKAPDESQLHTPLEKGLDQPAGENVKSTQAGNDTIRNM